jgi:PIN domain nuclease of toxin-antitoxin system
VRYVFDASVVLAILKREPGGDAWIAALDSSVISAVNVAEVASGLIRHGVARDQVGPVMAELKLFVMPPDEDLAVQAGLLRAETDRAGLSLADRFCLATAIRLGVPAVTADRQWATVAEGTGVEVRLIR